MILPTLAVNIPPNFKGVKFPLWGFVKVDGVRGVNTNLRFSGRSMENLKNTALVEKYSGAKYNFFDGEMTIHGYLRDSDLPDDLAAPDKAGDERKTLCSLTTGITNRAKLRKGETTLPTNVVWNLFDYLDPGMADAPYRLRYAKLVRLVDENFGADRLRAGVRVLPYTVVENAEEAQAFIEKCLDEGYEGAIFRDPESARKNGRATARDNDFWRFKPASTKDCLITGFEEALENRNEATTNALGRTERSSHQENLVGKGMIGTVLAIDKVSGKPIRLGPGMMTHKERVDWFNDPTQIIGWAAEYVSLDVGVKDKPRQARFKRRREKYDLAVAS